MPTNKTTKTTNYSGVRNTFNTRINSYKVLLAQTNTNTAAKGPSPTQLKSLAKWVEKGANIQNVTNAQLNRWAGKKNQNWTTTQVRSALCQKYGKTTIKAVAPSTKGGFIVATPSTVKGRTFKF